MKTSTFFTLAIAAAEAVTAVQFVSGPAGWPEAMQFKTREENTRRFLRRQARVVAPKRQELATRNPHIPGSKTVKVRYGPYTVPGARVPGGEGMITNRPSPSIDKPCSSCTILGMNAGLEYPNGDDANTNTLMWLHHMVMFNIGKGANDATCTVFGAPHLIVGSLPMSSERIFSSGNERTTTFFNPPWANVTDLGYAIFPADRFGLIIDLMNMNQQAKEAYLTIYYDYVDGHPAYFNHVKPVWLDAAQCGTSEVSGRTAGAKFNFASPPWISNFEGEVLGAGGHLHDGGTHLDIVVDGKTICTSVPTYGTDEQAMERADIAKKGGIAKAAPGGQTTAGGGHTAGHARRQAPKGQQPAAGKEMGGHSHGGGGQHIIAMSICAENKGDVKDIPISPIGIKDLKKGQSWTLRAYYDYAKFAGMKNHNTGGQSTVMGISIVYVKNKVKRTG